MIHGQTVRRLKTAVAASAIAALLGGCISASAGPDGTYATPIGNAPVTANPTPYSAALYCMADYARRYDLPSPRMAVGRIADYTGTVSADGGRQVTGGASLMAMTALAKSGARIVERYDTSVSEMELRYANNRLIGDAGPGSPCSGRGTGAARRHRHGPGPPRNGRLHRGRRRRRRGPRCPGRLAGVRRKLRTNPATQGALRA